MPTRPTPEIVIDARPRGPAGPLAGEQVLGRSVLAHHLGLAWALGAEPVVVHAREQEHGWLKDLVPCEGSGRVQFATGPPPENLATLRTDRIYDPTRLRRALSRGRDPESAVVWRLDGPEGLAGADAELIRRRTYQPLGRYWALAPARALARLLRPTRVRPNALTLAASALMLGGAGAVAFAAPSVAASLGTAAAFAVALVLDTADGHLARLQGTASEFGRWLDAYLDELSDLALHAAIAWSLFQRTGAAGWLLLGMLYGMGKYLFMAGTTGGPEPDKATSAGALQDDPSRLTKLVRLVGHADVRWHLWIVLAAWGRLELALAAYAVYFPGRSLAGALRKGVNRG